MITIFEQREEATLEGVSLIRKAARTKLKELRFPQGVINDVQLLIAEIGANPIDHASSKPSIINIKLSLNGLSLFLEVEDNGSPFHNFRQKMAAVGPYVDTLSHTSGRGLQLIAKHLRDPTYNSTDKINRFAGTIPLSPNRPRILFIEDEPVLLDFYSRMFVNFFDVMLASTTAEAFNIVKTNKIDLIIADMHLKYELSLDLIGKIEEDNDLALIPMVIYTGDSDERIHKIALEMGVEKVLQKPVTALVLKETVDMILAKAARQRAALFRYFATSVDSLMKKNVPQNFGNFNVRLIEGAAEIGSGDVVAHTKYDTFDRFVMADIMGHGLSATASAISFSTMVKMVLSLASPNQKAGEILTTLSHLHNKNTAFSDLMATVVVVDIHHRGKLDYALAGHPPLLLTRAGQNHLLKAGGPPPGLLADYHYDTHEILLHSSDRLVIYTDGIDPFGPTSAGKLPSWFTTTVKNHRSASIDDYSKHIEHDIIEQVGKRPADDWTVLIIEAGVLHNVEKNLAAA